jgi:hypothetical protein
MSAAFTHPRQCARGPLTGAEFSAGMVDFDRAVFSGGTVSFDGAEFCGALSSSVTRTSPSVTSSSWKSSAAGGT